MATLMSNKRVKLADPNRTKNGKIRIKGMTVPQLTAMIEKESKPKIKARMRQRIWELEQRPGYVAAPVVESAE